MFKRSFTALIASSVFSASAAWAAVSEVTPESFISAFHEEIDATPGRAWQSLVNVGGWWSSDHTYSGKASNLSLDPTAGGCWCERWSGNSVEHARVLVAMPGKLLRVEGGLGPLQALGATGVLAFKLTPHGEGTTLDVSYRVRATPDAGIDKLAPAVDGVLGEQVKRLVASMPKRAP